MLEIAIVLFIVEKFNLACKYIFLCRKYCLLDRLKGDFGLLYWKKMKMLQLLFQPLLFNLYLIWYLSSLLHPSNFSISLLSAQWNIYSKLCSVNNQTKRCKIFDIISKCGLIQSKPLLQAVSLLQSAPACSFSSFIEIF